MTEQTSRIIESHEIMQLLPHRYPFLLVDRVINFEEGKWLTAIKNISVNEPCFTGHFPGNPILPGVYSSGIPLQTNKEWRKTAALTLGIDGLNKRIKALEKKLKSDE